MRLKPSSTGCKLTSFSMLLVIALLVITVYTGFAETTHLSSAYPPSLIIKVEPRVTSVNGYLKITVLSLPPSLKVVAIRLEGNGFSSAYYTLAQNSTIVIDLKPLKLKPGIYYVAVYNVPGGILLHREIVLLVDLKLVFNPPRPTIGKPFTVSVIVQPQLNNIEYQIVLHVDNRTKILKPGEKWQLIFTDKSTHRICADIIVDINGTELYGQNIYCTSIKPNSPPTVKANFTIRDGIPVLYVEVKDVDGFIVLANYTCTVDSKTISGLLSPGLNTISFPQPLSSNATVKCTILAMDNDGAITVKEVSVNTALLLKKTASKKTVTAKKGKTQKQNTVTRPVPLRVRKQEIPLTLIIAIAAAIATIVYVTRRAMKTKGAEQPREKKSLHTPAEELSKEIEELIVRLDRLESNVGRLVGEIGEMHGEIDEIKNRMQGFEERLKELEEKFKLLSKRGGR